MKEEAAKRYIFDSNLPLIKLSKRKYRRRVRKRNCLIVDEEMLVFSKIETDEVDKRVDTQPID